MIRRRTGRFLTATPSLNRRAYRRFRRNQRAGQDLRGGAFDSWLRHDQPMKERLGYVPALDGLRGIAIALVIGDHFFGLTGGFFGVDIFFVLSGFLITTLLLEERDKTGGISLRAFYARRARRLLPALATILMLSVLFAVMDPLSLHVRLWGVGATSFYVANVYEMLGHRLPGEISQTWSLSQEEQFYLVWPAVLLFAFRRRVDVARLAWILLGLAVGVALWRVALVLHGAGSARLFFGPDTRADGLLLGCALAAARRAGIVWRALVGRVLPAAAIAGAAVIACAISMPQDSQASFMVGFPIVEVATSVLILAALNSRAPAALLSWRPLVGLGTISYSLYLWQGPIWMIFGRGGIVSASIVVVAAWLSYRFVEEPFRRRRVLQVEAAALANRVPSPSPV